MEDGIFIYGPGSNRTEPKQSKQSITFSAAIQLLAAAIAMISTIVGLADKHPLLARWLSPVGVLVFLWIALPQLRGTMRCVWNTFTDRRFVKREQKQLRGFLNRFDRFTSLQDSRRFVEVVRSARYVDGGSAADYQFLRYDFLSSWIDCFRKQFDGKDNSFSTFMARCREFTLIVANFNSNYVIRAQEQFEKGKALDEETLHRLDEFRGEFLAYLRDLELWAGAVSARAKLRFDDEFWAVAPSTNFERVKSFSRSLSQVNH